VPLIHREEFDGPTIRGEDHGASISLIIDEGEPGDGPRLHRHAYDESWVVQEGNISFQVGDSSSGPVQETWRSFRRACRTSFVNNGPGRSRIICIHANPTIVAEWLE
jgi:hypothetical protein